MQPTPEPPILHCLNCGELVPQNFCPNCGQERSDRIVPAAHLLHDAFDEFLKLDSKLGRSLIPLLTRPGFLTTEYIAGRRVRYVSPFRLYFIMSALFFLVFSFAHYDVTVMHDLAIGIEQLHPAHIAGDGDGDKEWETGRRGDIGNRRVDGGSLRGSARLLPSHRTNASDKADMAHPSMHSPEESSRPHRHAAAIEQTSAWFIKNQTVVTFLLVPIAALLLKLLYVGSKRFYIEHLVFAVHVQTFMFVLLLPSLLPFARNMTYIAVLIFSAGYLFLAMRNVYKQNIVATLVKCAVMLVSYMAIMGAISFCAFLVFYSAA